MVINAVFLSGTKKPARGWFVNECCLAGFGKLTYGHFVGMFTDHLFGTLAAAAAICAHTHFLPDCCVAVTVFNGLLQLLLRDAFT